MGASRVEFGVRFVWTGNRGSRGSWEGVEALVGRMRKEDSRVCEPKESVKVTEGVERGGGSMEKWLFVVLDVVFWQ